VKILIDTNVLIAAYTSYGVCANVVNYCMKKHQLCTSKFILTELEKTVKKSSIFQKKRRKRFLMCFCSEKFCSLFEKSERVFWKSVNKSLHIISTKFSPVLSSSHYCELLKTNPKNVEIKFQNYYII
jgi:predicted nucleic acid-binding protein